MSESVSLESLNSGSSSGDHHIGINKDQPTISAHHRRTTLLKPEMYNNEAEFNEQMSFKNNEIPVGEPGEDNLASMSQNGGSGFWNCHFSDYKSAAHRFMIWMSHLCVFVYVISAIIFWKFQEDRCLKWCDGLGMLIIIVVLIYSGLAYFHIKSHYGNALYNNVFKLVHRWLNPAMEHRYRKTVICFLPFIAIGVFLGIDTIGDSERLISCLGIVVIMGLGFIFSKSRSQIQWYPVLSGLLIQFLLGLVTIRWSIGRNIFHCIGDRVVVFLDYSNMGARFVYGSDLIDKGIFAFQSMSSVFFLSLVVHILYYYGIMQWIVIKIGWLIQVLMGTTVCESVNAAASVFLGISQGPLLLKPYLNDLTKSEMHAIMTAGFGTIAGTVFAAYINYGISSAHLITASVMSAPAALCYSKLLYPETEESKNKAENITLEKGDEYGVLDAATKGTMTALQLVLAIIANIIGFLSFITFVNGVLSWLGILVGIEGLTSEYLMGKVLIPLAWVIGVEWKECEDVAQLIGVKTAINEFVAYGQLGKLKLDKKLSPRSEMIATYALCGYSNFGAIAISIGSLIPLAPSQRKVITEVAFRAFIAGSATCFLTACIAGMLMPSHYVLDNTTQVHNASTEVP
ncbi:solute carrier family 28 member 3-like isoform X4 [Zootermopsis nevadensis]|uniref:Sodium/nucleoside cotransporter n=1 Tax=Zootermopsis nevadensis TaxID=136037 RepID=A0A067R0S4_ZOONE|nr:solute carrier family 28 member 3-like isoform X4 [Zootermopsis nevadensis]KDR11085.1 Solute carrier family 28 member 3 [Zootermopsis nevadensis]